MSLVTILSTAPAKKLQCIACDWLATRPVDEVEAINQAIANPDWTTSELWRVLCDAGMNASQSAFRSHIVAKH
jgi:hypothetical protein